MIALSSIGSDNTTLFNDLVVNSFLSEITIIDRMDCNVSLIQNIISELTVIRHRYDISIMISPSMRQLLDEPNIKPSQTTWYPSIAHTNTVESYSIRGLPIVSTSSSRAKPGNFISVHSLHSTTLKNTIKTASVISSARDNLSRMSSTVSHSHTTDGHLPTNTSNSANLSPVELVLLTMVALLAGLLIGIMMIGCFCYVKQRKRYITANIADNMTTINNNSFHYTVLPTNNEETEITAAVEIGEEHENVLDAI